MVKSLEARCAEVRARVSVARIVRRVSTLTGVLEADIMARTRQSDPATEARRIAMYECRAAGMDYSAIGRAFGRDHSTVIWACRQEEKARAKYSDCTGAAECVTNERGAGCYQHRDASNHSDAVEERRYHGC